MKTSKSAAQPVENKAIKRPRYNRRTIPKEENAHPMKGEEENVILDKRSSSLQNF